MNVKLRQLARRVYSLLSWLTFRAHLYGLILRAVALLFRITDARSAFIMNIRPSWIYSGAAWDSALPLAILFSRADLADDLRVVPRIISTFCSNVPRPGATLDPKLSGVAPVWEANLSERWGPLFSALWAKDESRVFSLLGSMFRQPFIWGLTYGNEVDRWPHRRPFLALNILGQVVEMAESLGVARTETPEQGLAYHEIRKGAERVASSIEEQLGIEIGFPEVSAAYGIKVGSRLQVQGQFAHIYAASRIRQHVSAFFSHDRPVNIVEIGGGYGGLCYWLHRLLGNRIASYTIVDLPSTGVLQAYFLTQALGDSADVALYDSSARKFDIPGDIRLVPHFALSTIDWNVDLVINQDSFPELPEGEVDRYLAWVCSKRAYFFSLNQEACAPVNGIPQLWVSQLCNKHAELKRVSRLRSWVRNGYVEELYETHPAAPALSKHS